VHKQTSSSVEATQVVVCLETTTCYVVCCQKCGKDFEPTNRRQRFCNATCRVAAHRASNPKPEPRPLKFYLNQRTGISLSFDGRTCGGLRDVGLDRPAGYAARHAAAKYVPSLVVDCV
jgi:hypothetical protein